MSFVNTVWSGYICESKSILDKILFSVAALTFFSGRAEVSSSSDRCADSQIPGQKTFIRVDAGPLIHWFSDERGSFSAGGKKRRRDCLPAFNSLEPLILWPPKPMFNLTRPGRNIFF